MPRAHTVLFLLHSIQSVLTLATPTTLNLTSDPGSTTVESQVTLVSTSQSSEDFSVDNCNVKVNIENKVRSNRVTTEVSTSFEPTAQLVYEVLNRVANHSWEWGTESEVILEMVYPELSVYSNTCLLPLSDSEDELPYPKKLIEFLDPILARRNTSTLPIVDGDGASGDPASLGVGVMIASLTTIGYTSRRYQKLVDDQLEWLLYYVPRSSEGALSQRNSELQYWSDFVYMAPPFLAYYGAAGSNITMLKFAYDQARLYRAALQDSNNGLALWQHIVQGSFEDKGLWSTGNGWAAAGMMRVYATFHNLRDPCLKAQTTSWREDLADWVLEIVNGAYNYQYTDTYLLPNYFATNNASHNYPEVSGTAIISSAAYRLASLDPSYIDRMPMAKIDQAREAIFTRYTNQQTGAVAPVVDPLDWNSAKAFNGSEPTFGFVSPEGQAFVLLLHEAWKAYCSSLNSQ